MFGYAGFPGLGFALLVWCLLNLVALVFDCCVWGCCDAEIWWFCYLIVCLVWLSEFFVLGEICFVSVWLVLVSDVCCFELVDTGFCDSFDVWFGFAVSFF